MQYEEFIARVQELSGISDRKKAEGITRAVLGTLGERIYRTEERQLAAQLPKELKDVFYTFQPPERGRGELATYPLEEFYNRVKARAEISLQESMRLSKIVLHVLQQAVSAGEIEDVKRELTPAFHRLFDDKNLEIHEPLPPFPKPTPEAYHVIPDEGKKWNVRKENGEVIATFDTKEQAMVHADDIADGDSGDYLVIHNADGSISKKREPASREIS